MVYLYPYIYICSSVTRPLVMEVELQQKLLSTRAEHQAVRARLATAEQQKKLLAVTESHVKNEQNQDRVWQSVGRMFVSVSTEQHEKDTKERAKEIEQQIDALKKKETYYATTVEKMMLALKTSD